MINIEATIRWKGYDPSLLSKDSHKRVWANCKMCGCGRWLEYRDYRDLCKSCASSIRTHSQETKQKISESHKGKNNPFYGKRHTEKTKQEISITRSGRNNSNWQGGISDNPYPEKWNNKIRVKIRNRDNNTCQICFLENSNTLSVHHIDYNKNNCNTENLISLCKSCHATINYNRNYWKKTLIDKINRRL